MRKVFTVNGYKLEFKDVIVEIEGKEEQGIRIKNLETKEEMITLDTEPFPQTNEEASRYTEDCFYCEKIRCGHSGGHCAGAGNGSGRCGGIPLVPQ